MNVFICEKKNPVFAIDISLVGDLLSYKLFDAVHKDYIEGYAQAPQGEQERNLHNQTDFARFTQNYGIKSDVIGEYSIDLSTLKNLPDFSDHASFMLYSDKTWRGESYHAGMMNQLVNLYPLTIASKSSASVFHSMNNVPMPLGNILVPFQDSNTSDYSLGVNVDDKELVILNGDLVASAAITLDVLRHEQLPIVKFDMSQQSVAKDGSIAIGFTLRSSSGDMITGNSADVYLETTGGVLSKTRVKTVNGSGSVEFYAAGLTSGDTVKMKCGFKYFTGTDSTVVTVQ